MTRLQRMIALSVVMGTLAACGGAVPNTGAAMPAATAAHATPDATMAQATPARIWLTTPLTNASTGATFTLAGMQGKVLLVEMMAVWCTNCLAQQKQVIALHQALGVRNDFNTIGIDVDPNEDAAKLKAYTEKQGFDWTYTVAPATVARDIGNLYGAQFLNPTSTPMVIIDKQGQVHPLEFGIRSAEMLQDLLAPYLK